MEKNANDTRCSQEVTHRTNENDKKPFFFSKDKKINHVSKNDRHVYFTIRTLAIRLKVYE